MMGLSVHLKVVSPKRDLPRVYITEWCSGVGMVWCSGVGVVWCYGVGVVLWCGMVWCYGFLHYLTNINFFNKLSQDVENLLAPPSHHSCNTNSVSV